MGGGVTDVAVLGTNVGTRKRKRWLQANARPVLITNPRLVETGVNLHEHGYSTVRRMTAQMIVRNASQAEETPVRLTD